MSRKSRAKRRHRRARERLIVRKAIIRLLGNIKMHQVDWEWHNIDWEWHNTPRQQYKIYDDEFVKKEYKI